MTWLRRLLGGLCIPAAAVPTTLLYSFAEDGELWHPELFVTMLVAAGVSFATFVACRRLTRDVQRHFLLGAAASYAVLFCLLLIGSAVSGCLAEMVMWLLVIVIFGIPFFSPMIGLAWLGCFLIFDRRETPAA